MSGAFFSILKSFLNSLSYPKGKISSDNSLKTNLAEFQKYKRLSVKDGSLNAETFQALGEELTPVQIKILCLHNPHLKPLFQGTPRNGFLYRPNLQPETITLDLNIVYEKGNFTEAQARETLKETVQDLINVYGRIKIEFKITLALGTGTDYDKASGFWNRIGSGAREGIINAFLFVNRKDYVSKSLTAFPAAQIMLGKDVNKIDPFSIVALAHEIGHLLLAYAGDGPYDSLSVRILGAENGGVFVFNRTQDFTEINPANAWLRNGFAVYGVDWVDDYRRIKNTSGSDRRNGATDSELQTRFPTVLDLYRVGAKIIAGQTK